MTLRARRFVTALLLSAAMAAGTTVPTVAAAQVYASPNQPNYASIVMDASTGEVLYGKRADSPRYPASLTKVMTLYLAFEAMAAGKLKADDLIVVSPRAAAQPPSKLGLRAGSTIRVDDAISALAVNSANDISVAMAERLGGTEQRFAALMTLRAQELGMRNTRFVNAHGLPDSRQLSSARDMAILSRAVMRDFPQYYGRFGQRSFKGHNNHNRLLHRMPGVDGLKTGFTNASGYNLAASAVRDGRRLIAVVLGGTTGASRDAHTADLLNAGFTVMASRARGERMELASMFPERTTMLASVTPTVEQGDRTPEKPTAAEAKELALALPETKLVSKLRGREALEEKAPKTKAEKAKAEKLKAEDAKLEKASDKKKAGKGEKAKASDEDEAPKGTWYVQVGAFPSKDGARDQLKTVLKKYATHFAKADGKVEKAGGNGHWRARYYGFSPDEAKAACKALDKKNVPCLAVKS